MLHFQVRANELLPFALPCLEGWPISAGELKDNYIKSIRVLGEHVAPDDDEEQGFFKKALAMASWEERVATKVDEESLSELQWRGHRDSESEARSLEQVASYSSAAPPPEPTADDAPCGLDAAARQRGREGAIGGSRARRLSESGCVWLLENACIEERRIVLFQGREALPKKLLGCGEFGNYDFNSLDIRRPGARRLFPNASEELPETLLVVPGLMSGVSLQNPFHLLHATVPVAWQLHHPSYGLCLSREDLDLRFAFFNAHHAKRSAHFWRVFSGTRSRPASAEDLTQQFSTAATWRFWWGTLVSRPPKPLGSDLAPRCYRRIVFGKELFRTGIGGFGTPKVVSFYERYLSALLQRVGTSSAGSADAEWALFEQMRPGVVHRDAAALGEFRSAYAGDFFTEAGARRLGLRPLRMWKAPGSPPTAKVETELVRPASALPRLRVLLVQRPKGMGRWIANVEEVLNFAENFRHKRASLALLVTDMGELHPIAQWQLATQANILVGVTGAALAWLAFMPRGAAVLDLFPPASNFCTEGWGTNPVSHYGGLARLAGVQHACMVHPAELQGPPMPGVQPEQQALLEVRQLLGGLWHGQNVRLDMAKFAAFFHEAVERVLPLL